MFLQQQHQTWRKKESKDFTIELQIIFPRPDTHLGQRLSRILSRLSLEVGIRRGRRRKQKEGGTELFNFPFFFFKKKINSDTVLDVGCGNGRHLLPVRESGAALFGCDLIPRFVEICVAERRLEVLRADAQHLPYRSHVFDTVLCVAVVHHFATHERRLRCIAELVRVTSLKGRVLVTAWALEQEQAEKSRRVFGAQDVAVPWVLPAASDPERQEEVKALPDEKARKALQPVAVERFCHVFVEGELEALVSQLPNVQIVESYYDNANWAVVLKKIAL